MSERCEYRLTLTLVSPFLFEGIVNTRLGVDCAQIRDERARPIIPAAQVKGVVRDALETLAERGDLIAKPDIDKLFGKSSLRGPDDTNEPFRGAAIFSDLVAINIPASPKDQRHTTRIEIDDESGAVKTGALQVIELAAPFGAEVAFSGSLIIRYPEELDRAKCEKALAKALKLIPAIGALKSAGFGAVNPEGCRFECLSVAQLALPTAVSGERIAYRITFDRPLLVDARYITDNLFESSKIIPGAVFKGALAERLLLAGQNPENNSDLSQALERLRISHAFPIVDDKKGELPIPASIVFRKRPDGIEYADAIAGGLGLAPLWGEEIAQFVVGAKKDVQQNWRTRARTPEVKVDLLPRTHIAINEKGDASGLRRIAFEDRLYTSAEGMLYTTVNLPVDGHEWLLTVDAGQAEDKRLAGQLVAVLEEGLDGIGKTGAHARFSRAGAPPAPNLPDGQIIDLMLQTPAVLFDPTKDRHMSMAERYAGYFSKTFGALLLNVFARQSMAGGYHAMRRRPYSPYYPFVLTDGGAVFRLKIANEESRRKLADALRFGLPVPELGGKTASWRNCPFMPENGYGEIVLHRPSGLSERALDFIAEEGIGSCSATVTKSA